MIGIGIDIGSTAAKATVVDGEGSVAWTCVQPTGFSSVDAAERLRGELAAAGYDVAADDVCVIATGYGRVAVPYAHKVVTEITCHGAGAVRLFGDHGTVIDVGGQDTKVIQLKSGRVAKFAMNDKCAAGTGRFLDVMARVLEVKVEELGALGAQSTKNLAISSTCTVFAESEVISQLAQGSDKRDIINGIHHSVASRVAGLAHRVGAKELVVSTLGVLYADDAEADAVSLGERIPITPLVAFGYMVFVLIYFPCIATLAAIKGESGSWKWAVFAGLYTTALAWLMSFAIYQIGGLFL